jgi:hypothetical protein
MTETSVGIRPAGNDHEMFIGDKTFQITDSQLLIFSRHLPTYLRRVVASRRPTTTADSGTDSPGSGNRHPLERRPSCDADSSFNR